MCLVMCLLACSGGGTLNSEGEAVPLVAIEGTTARIDGESVSEERTEVNLIVMPDREECAAAIDDKGEVVGGLSPLDKSRGLIAAPVS